MTKKEDITPFVTEISWEVCNRVGGIYTVLSTHAKQLTNHYGERLIFVGPDIERVFQTPPSELFSEEATELDAWQIKATEQGLAVRVGRWNVPGRPLAILVDFRSFFAQKDAFYTDLWNTYNVDSLHAYGDYDEACMFAWACGKVVQCLAESYAQTAPFVAHFHEWTTAAGLLYCKRYVPQVATVFTTHATSIGRSICGNGKDLYAYLSGYNGDGMAAELNMQSKHSIEKAAARQADCFTTVSGITGKECAQLLDKHPDVITVNGFEDDFVPSPSKAKKQRQWARTRLLGVAEAVLGKQLPQDTFLVATGGRYEFRNKGLDVFIESLKKMSEKLTPTDPTIVAFLLVPGDVSAPRQEVLEAMVAQEEARKTNDESAWNGPIWHPYNTHWLHHIENDRILQCIKYWQLHNLPNDKVNVLFVPCYLHGQDGIFNCSYYDLLQGFDLTVFLSYYEPWGYTPLESVAFSIPTMTTSLSGFGAWYMESGMLPSDISGGVAVIERNDGNYAEVVETAADICLEVARLDSDHRLLLRKKARAVSKKALWSKFIKHYLKAYQLAIEKAAARS